MKKINSFKSFYALKSIKRGCNVGRRKESTAEHIYSAIMLARVYLKRINGFDESKVMKLILYHDLVEVYAGDIKAWSGRFKLMKKKKEMQSFKKLLKTLPKEIALEFKNSWLEYEEAKTKEAIFCHAIDNLDGLLHNLDTVNHFRRYGLTEKRIRNLKGKYFEKFPLLNNDFNFVLKRLKRRGALD